MEPESAFARGHWSQIGGDGSGWPGDAFYKVRGLAWHQEELYVSLSGPGTDGPRGEVWRWDGRQWSATQAGWNVERSFVEHLISHRGSLYAAERSSVWRLADGRWRDVGAGLVDLDRSGGYAFAEWNGRLAMTFWGKPGVAVLEGERWMRLPAPADGWGAGTRTIYCAQEFQGCLYVGTGTGRRAGPPSAVWRFDGKGWEKIAGDGLRGSWIQPGVPFVLSLNVYGGMLIATVSRPPGTHAQASNVWAFDGSQWHPLGVGRVPRLMAESLIMNDSAVFRGRFVVATGDGTHRHAQLWQLEPDQSWRAVGGEHFRARLAEGTGGYWVYRLCAAGGTLFAGTAGHRGAARVFQFR